MPTGDSPDGKDPGLQGRLDAFARGRDVDGTVLPWAARLSPQDRERLRGELALVLSEPRLTGEPVDWREIEDILREWAHVPQAGTLPSARGAGWDGALVSPADPRPDGPYSVELRSSDAEALAKASSAVQEAVSALLTGNLLLVSQRRKPPALAAGRNSPAA